MGSNESGTKDHCQVIQAHLVAMLVAKDDSEVCEEGVEGGAVRGGKAFQLSGDAFVR